MLGTFARSQNLECHPRLEKIPVFTGGPVSPDRGWILHTDPEISEKKLLMQGLFLSGTVDSLKKLLEKGSQPLRLYLGYAGWMPGQLELEMVSGSWISAPVTLPNIFQLESTQAWDALFRQLGVDPMRVVSVSGVH
jgi:putative transcriptional regulator